MVPFFEEQIQNRNIHDFTLQFKHQSTVSKDYPYFSYIYRIHSKTQIRLKPISSKNAHFPIKNYYNLHFTITPQNQFFLTIPHTYFSTKFRTTFKFIEVFTDDIPDNCATIIQNSTNLIATVSTGHIGYTEVPITNEEHKNYEGIDITTLIHNVTYQSEITELVPQSNYSLQYNDDTVPSHQFSLHQVNMTNSDTPPITSPIYYVQHTSHTSKPRIFLHYDTLQKISNS